MTTLSIPECRRLLELRERVTNAASNGVFLASAHDLADQLAAALEIVAEAKALHKRGWIDAQYFKERAALLAKIEEAEKP